MAREMTEKSKMRLVGGGISHESFTFVPEYMLRRLGRQQYGQEALDSNRSVRTNLGAMIEVCEREGVELIPTVYDSPAS